MSKVKIQNKAGTSVLVAGVRIPAKGTGLIDSSRVHEIEGSSCLSLCDIEPAEEAIVPEAPVAKEEDTVKVPEAGKVEAPVAPESKEDPAEVSKVEADKDNSSKNRNRNK